MLLSATCRRFNALGTFGFVYFLFTTQCLTDTVLECPAVSIAHDTLVDDAETQLVTILCPTVTCERRDTRHRTRLGTDITISGSFSHTLLQGAVDTGNGERYP